LYHAAVDEPKSLGRYQIRGVLGKGAMGLVYDGHDATLNRRVAIKTILTRDLDESTARHYEKRFQREVRAVARLNHPHIVQVYDFGTEGDLAYIVMEYIEGKELKDYLDAKERFDLGTIFRFMGELLDALEFAHEAGVIHRDVKPANLMLDAGRKVKLTDFGVARITDPGGESADMTRAGAMIGTPSYMSPEQIQGQAIDRRTDIFSAGVLFYQLITGRKPFEGSGFPLAKKIMQDEAAPPSSLVQIPPAIDRVVARALAKAPERRYPSARAFAEALARVREGKPLEEAGPAEQEFWDGVRDSDDPAELELYIAQFPKGAFVELARRRMAELSGKKRR
jgi:eukaryotic-like serine/threonine-protein kinase